MYDFLTFYHREVELEQVLTTYTKINKSASIFLGSSKSEGDNSGAKPATSTRPPTNLSSRTQQSNMHGIIVNGNEGMKTSDWLFSLDEYCIGQWAKVL